MIESGEVFIRLVKQPFGDSKVPLGLEVIEADLLDDGYNVILKNGIKNLTFLERIVM